MKNFEKVTFAILVIVSLLSCQGKQGDPGPAGATGATGATGSDPTSAFLNGSFSGTVTGTRKDGTAINESFSFPYALSNEGFTTLLPDLQSLTLARQQRASGNELGYLNLSLVVKNKGQANESISLPHDYSTNFYFTKALVNNQLLSMYTAEGLVLDESSITYPIDPANSSYSFDFKYNVWDGYYSLVVLGEIVNGQYLLYFTSKANEKVYFHQPYQGGNFIKIVDASGVTSFTSATYGSLILG